MPFYKLWVEIESASTNGEGCLDKLRMELVGLDSSGWRPPMRDLRELGGRMLRRSGVPGVLRA